MFVFRIEVFTSTLQISASYHMPLYRRLSDALNDNPGPYLKLLDAIISPLERPQQAQRVSEIIVERSNILLVSALHEPDPPSTHETRMQTTNRDVLPVMFLTSAFAVQTHFYKRPDLSLSDMIEQHGDDFVPVRDVRIIPFHNPRSIARDFACLGRAHIHAFYAITSETPPMNGNEQPPDL